MPMNRTLNTLVVVALWGLFVAAGTGVSHAVLMPRAV